MTRLRKSLCYAAVLIALAATGRADTGDDTLTFFLSKSDAVLVGTIVTRPEGIITEVGVPRYSCKFLVEDVCMGNRELQEKTIQVSIRRFEMQEEDRNPLLQKGVKCILFLKEHHQEAATVWETADFWFGIQYPSPWMIASLKRLATKE